MVYELPLINLGVLDASGSRSTVGIRLRAGTDVPDARNAVDLFTSHVTALSGASVERQSIIYRGVESPRPAAPGGTSASHAGVFVFACSEPETYAVVQLPGLRPDLLLTTGPAAGIAIDQTAPDVVSFVDTLISGNYCNPFGLQLVALAAAFLQFRL